MLRNSRKIWSYILWSITFTAAIVSADGAFEVFAQGAAVEARVTSVRGVATISGNGQNGSKLVRGAVLAPGHEIDTRGGGRVVIDLSDGSQVVVLPGSRLVVGDYRTAGSLRELLQIMLGAIRVRINHFKNKPNPYRIKSPTASIAVRGTEFIVAVEAQGETRVTVLEGSVEVASLNDPDNPLLAEPGRGVIVRPDFTLDFFVAGLTPKGTEKNRNDAGTSDPNDFTIAPNSEAATSVYERFTENLIRDGEVISPQRFTAFSDAHLDSLENPAYAESFTAPEGQIYFLPSFSDRENPTEMNNANPVDYGVALQGTFFMPISRLRAVVGVSGNFVNNGLQSFSSENETSLPGGLTASARLGTTNNKFFEGALIAARKFGRNDRTSFGLSYERLTSNGNLGSGITVSNPDDAGKNGFRAAAFRVNRNRFTFGVKHSFGNIKLGVFYRFAKNETGTSSSVGTFMNPAAEINTNQSKGHFSEIGARLRGSFSPRFFYGAEGRISFGRSRGDLQSSETLRSIQRTTVNSAVLGFGVGYFLRSRSVISFDAAGGVIKSDRERRTNSTGVLSEKSDFSTKYLSLHAAVQTDIWRGLFVSASVFSVAQTRTSDSMFLPDKPGDKLNAFGVFAPNRRQRSSSFDFYSNFGIGWRFNPNLIFQYILTTDYGRTAPRHSFLLRYTFDFSNK